MAAHHDSIAKLRWQCRRGMRELDVLLLQYLEGHYLNAADEEKAAFQSVLELPDPELMGYLLQQHSPPSGLAVVIEHILKRNMS